MMRKLKSCSQKRIHKSWDWSSGQELRYKGLLHSKVSSLKLGSDAINSFGASPNVVLL